MADVVYIFKYEKEKEDRERREEEETIKKKNKEFDLIDAVNENNKRREQAKEERKRKEEQARIKEEQQARKKQEEENSRKSKFEKGLKVAAAGAGVIALTLGAQACEERISQPEIKTEEELHEEGISIGTEPSILLEKREELMTADNESYAEAQEFLLAELKYKIAQSVGKKVSIETEADIREMALRGDIKILSYEGTKSDPERKASITVDGKEYWDIDKFLAKYINSYATMDNMKDAKKLLGKDLSNKFISSDNGNFVTYELKMEQEQNNEIEEER